MILAVLSRTTHLALNSFGVLLAAGWGYMLVLIAVNLAISMALAPDGGFTTGSYMTEPFDRTDGAEQAQALRLLAVIANILAGFSIAVAYIRRILLHRRDFFLAFGARNIKVALKLGLLGVLYGVFLVPLSIASLLIGAAIGPLAVLALVAAPLVALMMVLKFSLILPAAAVDDDLSLGESWRATRGLGWALVVAATASILASGFITGAWALLLYLADTLIQAGGIAAQLRSALFPMGTMVIVTWIFASLHATTYALVRERFAEEVGFSADDVKRAQALRAVETVSRLGRDRG